LETRSGAAAANRAVAVTPPRAALPRLRVLALAVSAGLVLTFVGSLAALAVALYARSLSDAASMAVALQQYALRTMLTGDLISTIAGDAVTARGGLDGLEEDRDIHDLLRDLAAKLPEGSGMIIVGADGRMRAASAEFPSRPIDLSDRDWLVAHRDRGADLVVSPAVLSRVTGRIMFLMTRAVRDEAGQLVAVINLGVPSGSLIGAHALPRYGDGVVLTLMTRDGHLMARSDFPPELLGRQFPIEGMADDSQGFLRARPPDGRMAVQGTEIDPDYGFIARASIPLADVMAPLVRVGAVGLPILLALVWGTHWLIGSLARKQREAEQTSARLGAVLSASHLGSWHLTMPEGRYETNDRWAEMLGRKPEELSLTAEEWTRRLHPEERERVLAELGRAMTGQSPFFHVEHRMLHESGHWVWVLDSGCVVDRGAEGGSLLMTGTLLDISERRDAEQRVRVLMRELDHRAKNLLAVVYSIINLMRGDDVAEFKAAILGRVQALGHVHSLLSDSGWQGVDIRQLIRTETAAYQSDRTPRIVAEGPTILLRSAAAQALAMAVHELMTNSAKYGALSDPGGEARLSWGFASDGMLRLEWQDKGGPPVITPERMGFGTTLLTTMVRSQLEGDITAEWLPDGARFVLTFPKQNLCPRGTAEQGPLGPSPLET
jgi:PAS domain S-box-containing protein